MVGWIPEVLDVVEQPNNPVAHRPHKVGWLSRRVCLRRVNGVVRQKQVIALPLNYASHPF
jgi:hypothetical protein